MIKNKNRIIFLIYIISFLFIFRAVESQSDVDSNNKINLILLSVILIFVINIVILKYEVIWNFISGNYETLILVFSIFLLLFYFIPKIPFQSITGLFATGPTTTSTTITTTIPESENKTAESSAKKETTTTTTETTTTITGPSTSSTTTTTTSQTTVTSSTSTTISPTLTITFDRRLDCQKCGQHKAPPLTNVNITITAIISQQVDNTYLIDYYPKEWTIINSNGGQISSYNSNYNKIQWSMNSVDSSVSRWYIIKSPQRTIPPTDYYFFSEMEDLQSDTWQVKVTDPTEEPIEEITQPYDCSDINVYCTESTVTIHYPDGSEMTVNYQKPVNFFNTTSNEWQAINFTFHRDSTPFVMPYECGFGYDYCILGNYNASFKIDPTTTATARYEKNGTWTTYQPQSMFFRNFADAVNDKFKAGTPAKYVQSISGYPSFNIFNYSGIFMSDDSTVPNGVGRYDVIYEYRPDILKQELIIKNFGDLPKPTCLPEKKGIDCTNLTLDMDFYLDYDQSRIDIYVDGVKWTGSGKDVWTQSRVEFRDKNTGNVLWHLPRPYAYDSNETNISSVELTYEVKASNSYIILKTPYSWLNDSKRVYPVYIDPTTSIEYNTTIAFYKINNTLNDYYVNATDAQQKANDIQDYWTKNDVCVGLYFSNAWHEFCGIDYDWTWYNSTNYTTFSNLTGTAYKNYAGYKVDLKIEYYLEDDYPEILGKVTMENVGSKDIIDSYVKIHAYDIMVNQTSENDTFRINTTSFWESWSGYSEHSLNNSLNLIYTQNDLVSRKFAVFDNNTEAWIELEWNDSYWKNDVSYPMNYNVSVNKGSEYNAPVDLMLSTGALNSNNLITTNFKLTDAVKQNFNESMNILGDIINTIANFTLDAEENAVQYYIGDNNLSIEMKSNNLIHVENQYYDVNNTPSSFTQFFMTAWKFDCLEFPHPNSFSTLFCPGNTTNLLDTITSIVDQEIKLGERNATWFYGISYLLLNGQNGNLTDFNLKINGVNASNFEENKFRIARVQLPSLFTEEKYNDETEFDINYSGIISDSYCVRFPIYRWMDLTINVTMLDPISNFTFGREEFIIENYTVGNSVIARIRPYPCCDVPGFGLQTGEVCSG